MRKALGLLVVLSLVPVGLWAAAPAGSAVTGPTCHTLVAPGSFKPALPPITSKVTVSSVLKVSGKIGGCTGGGVTGGTTGASFKFGGNCNTLAAVAKSKRQLTAPGSITWNTGAVSTLSISTKLASAFGKQPLLLQLTVKITKGLFSGTSTALTIKGTAPAKTACLSTPLGSFTLTGKGTATFK